MLQSDVREKEPVMFTSFNQWWNEGPDVGNEYHPDPRSLTQSYQEWLDAHPEGYQC